MTFEKKNWVFDDVVTEEDANRWEEGIGDAHKHIANEENPHNVTKSQVGLGNVPNYSVSTESEAEAGESNTRFMTPLRTAQAIVSSGLAKAVDLVNHITNRSNPHQVTTQQVNQLPRNSYSADVIHTQYPIGITVFNVTEDELNYPSRYGVVLTINSDNGYVIQYFNRVSSSPGATELYYRIPAVGPPYAWGNWIVVESTEGAQAKVQAHANLTNNPHNVTKAQVGLGNVENYSLDNILLNPTFNDFRASAVKSLGGASTSPSSGTPFYILLARLDDRSRTVGTLMGSRSLASSNYDLGLYLVQAGNGQNGDGASVVALQSQNDGASLAKVTYASKEYIALKIIRNQHNRFDITHFQGVSTHLDEMKVVEDQDVSNEVAYNGGNARDISILGANGVVVGSDALAKQKDLDAHASLNNNPHQVTPAQIGAIPVNGGTVTGALQFRPSAGGGTVYASILPDGSVTSLAPFNFHDGITSRGAEVEAIVELGKNSNGHFIRYASGLQMCWSQPILVVADRSQAGGVIWRSDGIAWTYPVAFNDDYEINVTGACSAVNRLVGTTGNPFSGAVNFRLYHLSTTPASTAYTVRLQAIGRWK